MTIEQSLPWGSIGRGPFKATSIRATFAKNDPKLAGPARQGFNQIATAWHLTEMEQSALLGQPAASAFSALEAGLADDSSHETLMRLSYLIGIYRLLHTIFTDSQQADSWVRRLNNAPLFDGASALELMCRGRLEDLASVRRHLEDQGLGPA